jgi:hypothetical protein
VQVANQLPVGRPVKCPGCKNLYQVGAPGTVGTSPGPLQPLKPNVAPAVPPEEKSQGLRGWFRRIPERMGTMEWKQLLASSFFLFMFGLVPTIFAWSEWRVGETATKEPLAVELAQLETGPAPQNNHLKIGPHVACYFAAIFSYTTRQGERRRVDENTKVDYAFYPIISTSHPRWEEIRKLQEKYQNRKDPPDNIPWPRFSDIRVLVRTDRFRTVGGIPDDDVRNEASVQGLVINKISSLKSEEQKLIRDDFPNINFDKVLILSEGRRPSSGLFALFLLALGLAFWFWLFGMCSVWLFWRGKQLVQRVAGRRKA